MVAALADADAEAGLADGLLDSPLGDMEADARGLLDRLVDTALAEVEGVIGLRDALADITLGDAEAVNGMGRALRLGAGWTIP